MKNQDVMRLDKWLWCARFYKTRSLASSAVKGGKIRVNDLEAKPSRLVQVGDRLRVVQQPYRYDVTIEALAASRGPAGQALRLYTESGPSQAERETLAARLKLERQLLPPVGKRPDKRTRRGIIRFSRESD